MPARLDVDLRLRVVETYESGEATVPQVAERFRVGPASLKHWMPCRLRSLRPAPPCRPRWHRHSSSTVGTEPRMDDRAPHG